MITGSKYNMLYPPLVERVYNEETQKGSKNVDKTVKTRLHQMFGAYVQGNAHKKAKLLLDELAKHPPARNNPDMEQSPIFVKLLLLHASTKERLPHIKPFCSFISASIPNIETILDLGCGFNPFTIPYLRIPNLKAYHAYDIDLRTKDLLNYYFELLNLPKAAACADLVTENPTENVDLAIMAKLLPVLEAQRPGRGYELIRRLNAGHLIITYPLKSLGGREKGMGKNYAAQFSKAREDGLLGKFQLETSAEIGSELIYLLKKEENS